MDSTDTYRTLGRPAEHRIKVIGSVFLGAAAPVQTQSAAEEFIRSRRELHFDATHHCSAWRLGTRGDRFRQHDDGEPSGTGGRPLLAAIDHAGLTDVVVVVTRWFGGTKLGTGGLARAYGEAAAGALAAGGAEERHELVRMEVTFAHELTSAVMHTAAQAGARIARSAYDTHAHIELEVRRSVAGELRDRLIDATRGAARVETVTGPGE
jgi:uncharacterized YigZ family protein